MISCVVLFFFLYFQEPNTLWYKSNSENIISCVKFYVASGDGVVSALESSLFSCNQV